ncbi:MAG: M48 family metallopeptidase, partial [Balneolales bacterium]
MDFFESQENARKLTRRLVLLYLLAVVLIITTVYVVVSMIFLDPAARVGDTMVQRLWNAELFFTVAIATLIVIISGTLFRVIQLRGGGASVAEMMGGRKINPSTTDQNERRLVNVVEEMSIASGVAVPDIFVMDKEDSINAFAAGYSTNDAAVAVTRGTLEQLNRDELQGVIAHEFSHIFNGDMRLNVRLIGILNGILLLNLLGFMLLRGGIYGSMGRRRSRSNGDKGGGAAAILALAIGLIVIGYIGMLFGRMIQSAVSRQREYLADSAAVQYTRNPEGLAGALSKIRDAARDLKIQDAHAMELSHMFFASGFRSALDSLFATHPPIEKRLQAIDPNYKRRAESEKAQSRSSQKARAMDEAQAAQKETTAPSSGRFFGDSAASNHAFIRPELLMSAIGTPGEQSISRARSIMQDIPDDLLNAAHEPLDAKALIYFLLINEDPGITHKQMGLLQEEAESGVLEKISTFSKYSDKMRVEWNLPLVDLSVPALRNLSPGQYTQFKTNIEKLIQADKKVSLFEFTLEKVLMRHLGVNYQERKEEKIVYHNLKPLATELSILLSALAHESEKDSKKAFQNAIHVIEKISPKLTLIEEDGISFDKIDKSLNKLAQSAGPVKKYFLHAAIACISFDNQVAIEEMELLRAMADTIDVPL